jgi:drug/metabolite transporter (DMT)-like permease
MLPLVVNRRDEVVTAWRVDLWTIVGIAIMSSAAYLIILYVLAFSPVSYVAPMRTLSILIGVLLGTNLLKEEDMGRRVIAAIAIIIGVILLHIG